MTTNETPTPRTDAIADYWLEPGMGAEREIVPASFGRELERELAEARKQVADWQVLQATTEQKLAREKLRAEQNGKLAHNLGIELVAERALADRLAAELEPAAWLCGYDHPNSAEQALAAWKEARNE